MNTTLWILQILLSATFLGSGLLKLLRPIDDLAPVIGDWVYDVPSALIRTVAALEVAAAIGLTLPAAVDVLPWLTVPAAAGLVVVMAGAIVTHLRRNEGSKVAMNAALAAIAVIVVWGRVGPYSF